MSESGGVRVGYGDVLDGSGTSSALTGVSGWEVRRGRQDEFQRTGTGTATVFVNDQDGSFVGGEFPTHISISLRGTTVFTGHVDEVNCEVDPSGLVTRVQIECVDALDFLATCEAVPGVWGNVAPAGMESQVFYEDGQVDDRIIKVLADVGWPTSLQSIFSGNVNVIESVYQAGTPALQIMQDAADAEQPAVANIYIAKDGTVSFRGRFARFNPSNTQYGISAWEAGTESHVQSGVAQIRRLSFSKQRKQIYNTALAYPQGIKETDIPDMIVTDTGSVSKYGARGWSAENLLTKRHNSNGNTGADECKLFSQYIVDNFSDAQSRVTMVAFRSLRDGDPRASDVWALMTGVEIGDTINLTTDWVSGDYFVEGITTSAKELDGTIPDATVELDLSPRAFWDSDPF